MKKTSIKILIVALLLPALSIAQPKAPSGQQWVVVEELTDEFDHWDESKWDYSLWNYEAPVKMMAKNGGVADGKLWIKATLGEDKERWFETSRVQSKVKIGFPMYTECRMKTSHISAFSTYWLNNGNIRNRNEIDVCEHNTNPSWPDMADRPYTMYSQYFIVVDDDTERANGNFDNRKLSDGNPAKGKKWNEDYQVLGCYWKNEHEVIFYINGEEAGSVKSKRKYTRKLNIIWDLWTSEHEWTGGIADKEDLADDSINTMYVDWIHTYTLKAKK